MIRRWGRRIAFGGGALAVLMLAVVTVLVESVSLPSYQEVRTRWQSSESQLLDRHGQIIHELRVDSSGRRLEWSELKDIAPVFLEAAVVIEDRRFWQHPGVDLLAMASSATNILAGHRSRGASTITMQTASFLLPELAPRRGRRTFSQKWRQAVSALALDSRWSKEEILTAYVNLACYRGELQGITAAAAALCGKLPSGLNRIEAAILVALFANPNSDQTTLIRRVRSMVAASNVPALEREIGALVVAMTTREPKLPARVTLAPHLARKMLHSAGEKKRVSLDIGVQRLASEALVDQLAGLAGQNVRDGAVLVVENATGDILAYVSDGGPRSSAPYVDGTTARRQAGSTLKPFLYALALEKRYLTAASVLEDSPLAIDEGLGLYAPQNYDRDFKGAVSLRTALASSLNVPAVRTIMLVGVTPFYSQLQRLGYKGLLDDPEHYGHALALGAAEVSLFEQVRAYRALARDGVYGPLRFTDEKSAVADERLLSQETAYLIGDILSDRAGRSLTFGLANPLATRYWSAVKTGTSKDMRDNWCIGWSNRYTVGVWVGNFEGDAMQQVSGITGAAPVWREVMDFLHAGGDAPPPSPPKGIVRRQVRFEPAIEPARDECFLAGTEQEVVRISRAEEMSARITEPADGTVVAIDPEIPFSRQAILFKARGDVAGLRWFLDGEVLAESAAPLFWHPKPGSHELILAADKGSVTDRVRLEVRGRAQFF